MGQNNDGSAGFPEKKNGLLADDYNLRAKHIKEKTTAAEAALSALESLAVEIGALNAAYRAAETRVRLKTDASGLADPENPKLIVTCEALDGTPKLKLELTGRAFSASKVHSWTPQFSAVYDRADGEPDASSPGVYSGMAELPAYVSRFITQVETAGKFTDAQVLMIAKLMNPPKTAPRGRATKYGGVA